MVNPFWFNGTKKPRLPPLSRHHSYHSVQRAAWIRKHFLLYHTQAKDVFDPICHTHRKYGPGKNGPAGQNLDAKLFRADIFGWLKMVQPDQFWQLKLVRPEQKWSGVTNSVRMFPVPSTIPNVVFSSFLCHSLLLYVYSYACVCSYELALKQLPS